MATSDVNQSMATLFMPEQASPPIPAAGTADACALYCNGTDLLLSVNGGAYAAIGGGGGGSLDAAYNLGSQINVVTGLGPVIMDTAQTSGEVLLISSSGAPTLGAPLTGISVDMSGVDPNGHDLTGVNIVMTTGTPGTSKITGLSITGASSTKAKARKAALLYVNSRASAASAAQIIVRNTSALAGSLVLVGWDSEDFNGVTQNSVLTGTTHMLTLDGQTNVTAGAQEFVGLRVLMPTSTSSSTIGISMDSAQTAGALIVLTATGTLTSAFSGHVMRLNAIAGGFTQSVLGFVVRMPATTHSDSSGYYVSTVQTAGSMFKGLFESGTTLSGTLTGLSLDLATNVSGGLSNIIFGSRVTMPATTSTSSQAFSVQSAMSAGAWFVGSATAMSMSGLVVGLALDLVTGVTTNGNQLVGISIGTAITSSSTARGITITSANTHASASVAEFLLTPGSAGNANCIRADVGANITSGAGTDGNLLYGTVSGAAARGVRVQTLTFTGAHTGGYLGLFYRTGAWSGGGTESVPMFSSYRDVDISATSTLSAPVIQATSIPVISGGTVTYSANDVTISRTPNRTGGTANLSGSLLFITHAPTGTINTDATTGLSITMTPVSSAGVIGQLIDMGANATGAALAIAHAGSGANQDQVIFKSLVDGTGAHLRGPLSGTFVLKGGTATQTSAAVSGRDVAVTGSNAVAGSSSAGAAAGGNVSLTGGDAARLTSGDANGGTVSLLPGAGIGAGVRGAVIICGNTSDTLAFFNAAGATKTTPTGSRGGNAALASLLTALAGYGLIVDGTSA